MNRRFVLAIALSLLGSVLLYWTGLLVWGDEPRRASNWQLADLDDAYRDLAPENANFRYEGVEACRRCHREPLPEDLVSGSDQFISLREAEVWNTKDKHAAAFTQILPENNPLAKQMIERLEIANIRSAKECLSCHSNWQHQTRPEQRDHPPPDFARGVTCEACHGPSSGWEKPHRDPAWRTIAPQTKASWGLVDLRHPTIRAQQCFNCHIGNAVEGKVLTHAMYAAGHPPLPSIELDTFLDAMPPHWRHTSEKGEFANRAGFVKANPQAVASGNLHHSRSALISAVIALQASTQLVTAERLSAGGVPDFALFDCYACHHELKTPATRPAALGMGLPGRPHPAPWPAVLLPAALAYVDEDVVGVKEGLAQYQRAFDRRPFGEARMLKGSDAALTKALESLISKLESAPCDQAAIRRALLALASAKPVNDYDSARQIAWTLRVLYRDLAPPPPHDREIQMLFARWQSALHLEFPATQTKSISNDLALRWKLIADFDPAAFQNDLAQLHKLFISP